MINGKLFLVFAIISPTISQDIRSVYLSQVNDVKYQCSDPGCAPSTVVSTSDSRDCQFICLSNAECRTITFDSSTNQCEIFADIPSMNGNIVAQVGVVTMTADDERQLSAPKKANTTTRTTTTTTSTTTTRTTSTTTVSANPCATGNLRWNTSGITVLDSVAASGLYVDENDTLYAVDENINFAVWKLPKNAANAIIIAGIRGLNGSNSSQLNFPNDVYVDKKGNMYVSDTYNYRIQKYVDGSMEGLTIAGMTGASGSALNQFNYQRYISFDTTEAYAYVADQHNHRIMRYLTNSTSGMNGTLVAGGNGANNINTSLNAPWGIHNVRTVSNDLFITNLGGHSVMRWTPGAASGVFIAGAPGSSGFSPTQLSSPMGIKVDTYLNVFVVDNGNHRVQMFCNNNRTGITVAGISGAAGNTEKKLNSPRGIVFDSAMNMYIGDTENRRIQKFLKL